MKEPRQITELGCGSWQRRRRPRQIFPSFSTPIFSIWRNTPTNRTIRERVRDWCKVENA